MAEFKPVYADLTPYRQGVGYNPVSPLDSALQGLQQGIQLQQLPQTLQDQQLARQLNNALNAQKLYDLQHPDEAFNRKLQEELTLKGLGNSDLGIGPSEIPGATIANPGTLTQGQTATLPSQELMNQRQVAFDQAGVPIPPLPTAQAGLNETPIKGLGGKDLGLSFNPNVPKAASQEKADLQAQIAMLNHPDRKTSESNLQFRDIGSAVIGLDPVTGKEVSRIAKDASKKVMSTAQGLFEFDPANPTEGRIIPGTEKTGKSADLTPSQIISSKREIRATYDELPSKTDYFGKGQVPGSNQLKTRLDAVLKPVNGDFSKLNPQAKQTFVFAINKLRDPTSATLLSEAQQIAARAGIGDRFSAFIANWKEGDPLPDQVAKDIYQVISQVEATHKENLINELVQLKNDTDSLGIKLTSIGVPKALQDEVENRIKNPISPTVGNTSSIPTITTQEQFNSLPSGAEYISENGKKHKKP